MNPGPSASHAWAEPPQTARTAQEPEGRRRGAKRILREAEAHPAARHPEVSISAEQVAETAVTVLVARGATSEMLVLGSRGRGVVSGRLLGSAGGRCSRGPGARRPCSRTARGRCSSAPAEAPPDVPSGP
ncbi:universal stress protein [Streptomyces sp. 7N604]|uniref:universal stress protein n=1 Tax=Streptomyces sp. 7N604 TaxID=3457415 RepID=UPI003FD28A22